jgi:hypothetical protein
MKEAKKQEEIIKSLKAQVEKSEQNLQNFKARNTEHIKRVLDKKKLEIQNSF